MQSPYTAYSPVSWYNREESHSGQLYHLYKAVLSLCPEYDTSLRYYKTHRGYHKRSLNSNGGWNVIGCMSFMNQPILQYSNEIRSAVLIMHGEKAHSCYFSRDAYDAMVKDNPYTDNKELLIIPDAVHTDLYDGGGKDAIPFDKLEQFFSENMR